MVEILITNGIKITVQVVYHAQASIPRERKHIFAYRVWIENQSEQTVRLMRRHWYIHDAGTPCREVVGDGVVGCQPFIAPGKTYQYDSWTQLFSEVGKMSGFYTMLRQDGYCFDVVIPDFNMLTPWRSN